MNLPLNRIAREIREMDNQQNYKTELQNNIDQLSKPLKELITKVNQPCSDTIY